MMNEITVQKEQLRSLIEENRTKHRAAFEEALEAYRAEAVRILDERIRDVRENRKVDVAFRLVRPEDHTADYDTVLGMLAMHLGDEVKITFDQYRCFVEDDWGWRDQFATLYNTYTGKDL